MQNNYISAQCEEESEGVLGDGFNGSSWYVGHEDATGLAGGERDHVGPFIKSVSIRFIEEMHRGGG